MQLHQLGRNSYKRRKKRVGRGGKRGTYSGRGQKGQKARAGRKIRPAERDLFQRFPKLRGVKHSAVTAKPKIFNLADLEKIFVTELINKQSFIEKGIIKRISEPIKILGNGEIKRAITIEGLKISQKARAKIEAAGGVVKN